MDPQAIAAVHGLPVAAVDEDAPGPQEPYSEELATLVRQMLLVLGEEPERPGLLKTPARVSRSLAFLTAGYHEDPAQMISEAVFQEPDASMVVVRDIEFYSLCEHHMLPFFGRCHVAYLSNGKIVGLSKLPRLVDAFARRLQVQERLTNQIAAALDETLAPRGVGVVIEASHLCMMMRGVQKQGTSTLTMCVRGQFREDPNLCAQFMGLIRGTGEK
jgi:GTP cyclohydrolase I